MASPLYLSANGQRVVSADVLIPFYGIPVADISLAGDAALTTSVELQVANLTLRMTVLRQAPFAGARTSRLVGGAGGWGRDVTPRAYSLSAGVPLSMVLRDIASDIGETVVLATDRSVGLFYVREQGPAQRVLRQLCGESWHVDTAGVTQVRARPTTKIKSAAIVEDYSGGKGWLTVATEDLASWQPGATYQNNTVLSAITVSATRIRANADGNLRLEVLTT